MALLSAQELLQRHGIDYIATSRGRYTTKCPNCGEAGYLNVEEKKDAIVWYCHNCDEGGSEAFEQDDQPKKSELGKPVAVFDYCDEDGKRLFQVLRFEPLHAAKQYRQRTGPEQEKWSIKGVRLVPYRLPELIEALANNQVIFVVEGEKKVEVLRAQGAVATCNAMGAGKWRDNYSEYLNDADIVIIPDNDAPGRAHAAQVARSVKSHARRVRLLDLAIIWPAIEPSDDIYDWFKAGHDIEELWAQVEKLSDWHANGNGPDYYVKVLKSGIRFLDMKGFVADFHPPNYLIDGMLQRRFVYALTGPTGHAKTAIALSIAELVSSGGGSLGGHRVERGNVVYFVGENPDDLRMRIIGANAKREDDPTRDHIYFIPGVFDIDAMYEAISDCVDQIDGADLVVIDTSAAYFLGQDENSNPEMGIHARKLRHFTELSGGPCVLVLCHPIKHAADPSQLSPRGGGAFLAEMDGNLTAWKHDENLVDLHYNKMRGPGFEMLTFQLETIKTEKLVDSKGRELPTVRAKAISTTEEEHQQDAMRDEQDTMLTVMLKDPGLSISGLAQACGWGSTSKSKVHRILKALGGERHALVRSNRGKWILTEAGKEEARQVALKVAR